MGIRKYRRQIARECLEYLGMERINKRFGLQISRSKLREAFRCMGRENRAKLWKALREKPLWRRALWGDLARKYERERAARQPKPARMELGKDNFFR